MSNAKAFRTLPPESARIELGHTLRMLKLSQDSLMIAKGTMGMELVGFAANQKVDVAAASIADAMHIIAARLDA